MQNAWVFIYTSAVLAGGDVRKTGLADWDSETRKKANGSAWDAIGVLGENGDVADMLGASEGGGREESRHGKVAERMA